MTKFYAVKPVSPADEEVKEMIRRLDHFQISLYGVVHCHLDSPETLLKSKAHMLGAFDESELVGIGAVKLFDDYAEIKRMFVFESHRGQGIAEKILRELEKHASEQGINRIYLETGIKQTAAVKLYQRLGYTPVESFPGYKPNSVSLYFTKTIV